MDELKPKKKTRQTEQSGEDNEKKNIESEMEGNNIGENMTYDVLRMLLEYLNIGELAMAAMVCRSWNEAAEKEIQTRIKPQTALYLLETRNTKHVVPETSTDKLFIKPDIGLLFVGRQLQTIVYQDITEDIFNHRVPCGTDLLAVWNYGVVHEDNELDGDRVSSIYFPKIPGVKIKFFVINKKKLSELGKSKKKEREILARKYLKISPEEENIKSIILFVNEEDEDSNLDDVKQLLRASLSQQKNQGDKISIWGGVTSGLSICNSESNQGPCCDVVYLAGISICGAGVSTWSIVLDRRVKTKAQAEKELTAFKDTVKLQKYSAGFMFACCGRGEDWYSEKHVEPKIFKRLFPNVPLVGSFGGGEFGLTTIPRECSAGIIHQFSTIFLILTYGSMRN